MKKLLMLGTSFASMEILTKARQRGWHVIVTDNLPPERSPVKQAADECWMISTADTDHLEEKCRTEGVDAIFSGVSEFNLDRVRILTRDLGLPCYIDEGAWAYARNKRLFKKKCMEKGIPVVPEYPLPAPDDEAAWARIVYPVVVKPVDGSGNAGLSICRNSEELKAAILKARSASTHPEMIIERYITGDETWNMYVIAENTARYLYSGRAYRQPGYPTFLYSFTSTAADGVDDYLACMGTQCAELLREIGCRDGFAWIQCIRDGEGNYYALEMAHRMSAGVSADLLKETLGFNVVDWLLDTALGETHTADMLPQPVERPYTGALCGYLLFADHAGRIETMSGLDKLDSRRFRVESAIRTGDSVDPYRMMGKITFSSRTAEEMCRTLQEVNDAIDIRDTEGRDMIVRFTDLEAVRQGHRGLMRDEV